LPVWNADRSFTVSGEQPSFLLIADDVVGGFFAIDGGGLGFERGKVCYLPPDILAWENLGVGYSAFVNWSFAGDLAKYYETARWKGWQDDVRSIRGDEVFGFTPPLCVAGPPIGERSKEFVCVAEIYDLHIARSNK
jgi:hypothetical protein